MSTPTVTSLQTNTTNKPHMHARWTIKDGGTALEEIVKTYKTSDSPTIVGKLDEFKSKFVFIEYDESYARDKEGNTEYVRFEATIQGDFQLQLDLFTCYCEPLNENQEPPF